MKVGGVLPEGQGVLDGGVAKRGKVGDEAVLYDAVVLFEDVHPFTYFDIYVPLGN